MLNITEVIKDLKYDFEWQNAPRPLYDEDFEYMVKRAVRMFFKDINRPTEWDESLFITGTDGKKYYDRDFDAREIEYLYDLVKISFLQRVQSDMDARPNYSTDALKVSGVTQAWGNLDLKIDKLQHERRVDYYKMTEYTLGNAPSDE